MMKVFHQWLLFLTFDNRVKQRQVNENIEFLR